MDWTLAVVSQNQVFIIIVVVVLLFGAAAIPKLARALGRAQGEFKKAQSEFKQEMAAGEESAAGPSDEQIRKTAEDLGIATEGKSTSELKEAINEKLA